MLAHSLARQTRLTMMVADDLANSGFAKRVVAVKFIMLSVSMAAGMVSSTW
ncbi:MAG: hypothetical protein IME93_07830 [Proteobacteria bacterium]|nr:hypothetical protein [Pseudomonadota bacterium]